MKTLLFIKDLLDQITPFQKIISHVHLARTKDGDIRAACPATDRSLEFLVYPKEELEDLDGIACFGNLLYLRNLLSANLTKDCEPELLFEESEGRKLLRSIRFNSNRYSLLYSATDPFFGNLVMPSKIKITDWPFRFEIDDPLREEFKEIRSIMNSAGQDKGTVTVLSAKSDLTAIFGQGANSSSLILPIKVLTPSKELHQGKYLTDHLARVLDQVPKQGIGYFSPQALRVEYETDHGLVQIVLVARKSVEDF